MHYIRCRRLYIYDNTPPPTLAFRKIFSGTDSMFVRNITHTHARTHPRTRLLGNQYTHTPNIHILLLRHVVLFGGRTIDIPSSSSGAGESVEAGGKRAAQRKSSRRQRRGVLGRGRRPVAAAAQVGI